MQVTSALGPALQQASAARTAGTPVAQAAADAAKQVESQAGGKLMPANRQAVLDAVYKLYTGKPAPHGAGAPTGTLTPVGAAPKPKPAGGTKPADAPAPAAPKEEEKKPEGEEEKPKDGDKAKSGGKNETLPALGPLTPAKLASIIVPAVGASLGFLALLCCCGGFLRKKALKQWESDKAELPTAASTAPSASAGGAPAGRSASGKAV